jgi:hypothetical protein
MPRHTILPAVLLLVTLGTAACTTGGAAGSSGSSTDGEPGTTPGADPTPAVTPADYLAHPTGPTDIILSFDEGGGFVPIEFLAAHVPYFTLYGDGTVVFVPSSTVLEPPTDNVMTGTPPRTARLDEEQIQALLLYALRDGGLALAKEQYQNQMVADAGTATFTVSADNDTKTVSAYALGIEGEPGPDTAILGALAKLANRLRDFDQGGTLASAPYQPKAYRGVLIEAQGVQGVQIRDWPWPDLAPADFARPADPNVLQQGTRTLTDAEVAALGVDGYEGGISSGVWVTGPDGKVYSVSIRPLLPHETA